MAVIALLGYRQPAQLEWLLELRGIGSDICGGETELGARRGIEGVVREGREAIIVEQPLLPAQALGGTIARLPQLCKITLLLCLAYMVVLDGVVLQTK